MSKKKRRSRSKQSTTIRVTVSYDGELPALIGGVYQEWEMDTPATFDQLFLNIERQFPALTEHYPPGTLGIMINGQPVSNPQQALHDGDIVGFVAPVTGQTLPDLASEPAEARANAEAELIRILTTYPLSTSLLDIKARIYAEESHDDFKSLLDLASQVSDRGEDAMQEVIEALTNAWNVFPHRALDNRSPLEVKREALLQ